jgi:malate synthase
VTLPEEGRDSEILTPDAMRFLRELHKKFDGRRQQLLAKRRALQLKIDAGQYTPDFDPETKSLRSDTTWHGSSIPKDMLVKDIIFFIHRLTIVIHSGSSSRDHWPN